VIIIPSVAVTVPVTTTVIVPVIPVIISFKPVEVFHFPDPKVSGGTDKDPHIVPAKEEAAGRDQALPLLIIPPSHFKYLYTVVSALQVGDIDLAPVAEVYPAIDHDFEITHAVQCHHGPSVRCEYCNHEQ
jgi:hypothetical protein